MLSVPPIDRLWQELQEMKPDFDRRGSKHASAELGHRRVGDNGRAQSVEWVPRAAYTGTARAIRTPK
jgi:hypothetical protein